MNIHFLLLSRSHMTLKRLKSVQGPTWTFSWAQWSLSWVRDDSQQVSYPCGDAWCKGQTVLCTLSNPQGFEGQSAFLQTVAKKLWMTAEEEKKLCCCHSPAFRATQTDRYAYLRVTTKWFHAVSPHLFSLTGVESPLHEKHHKKGRSYESVLCVWELAAHISPL